MVRNIRSDRRAISPVIATIIIVAVAIVMSIAVAYWMMGLATTFTRYEKLEYTAAYAVSGGGGWNITIIVKNTGSAVATISNFFFNGIPFEEISNGSVTITCNNADFNSTVGVPLDPGESMKFLIDLPSYIKIGTYSPAPGITLEITIATATGNQYPKTIVLP